MTRHKLLATLLFSEGIAILNWPGSAHGAEVYGGSGIGFANNPSQWVANVVFAKQDKKALKKGLTVSFHSGQDLTPACAISSALDCPKDQTGLASLTVPTTTSVAWCDSQANPHAASANKYRITAVFEEPAYSTISVPRDTVFTGSFTWDSNTKTLGSLRGTMNQVMVSADPTLNLTHLLNWSYDGPSNSVTASVFRNDSTAIYSSGSYDQVSSSPDTDGTSNAYFTLNFNASDPTAATQSHIDKLVYGDCIGGSLMGEMCMTGLVPEGSMGGYPQSLTITAEAAAEPPTDGDCYGSALGSKWAVVDLNGLRKAGLKSVWVTVTAKRFDDRDGTAADDDLIPALTVFLGRQDVGVHGYWYPNRFQQTPTFWAWKLSPFHTTTAESDTSGGWVTANGTDSPTSASVTGKVPLKAGNQNFLTIAVGGDARDAAARHDVNFELTVTVSRTKAN